jgi:hypothetical protein
LSKLPVRRPVVFPLSSCQGLLTLHIYNCIAEIENNYFNFAEGRKNTEDKRETEELEACRVRTKHRRTLAIQANQPTSEREYEVDAQALKADEGRGDRRNVQGELHASEEP